MQADQRFRIVMQQRPHSSADIEETTFCIQFVGDIGQVIDEAKISIMRELEASQ